jgi:hypothetical protein
MRELSGPELFDLWERGCDLHPLDQILLALHAALPGASLTSLADWPLGRRNRALMDLHRLHFGPLLAGWTSCARCGERMEFGIDARALAGSSGDGEGAETIAFEDRSFRLPTSRDLAESIQLPDPETAALRLMERCRTDAGDAVAWTEEEVETIGERMAEADPLSEIRIALACPQCGNASQETLEIGRFLWSEIEARARRSAREVHELATAYGWPESAILSLSPQRRALYLEMVRR